MIKLAKKTCLQKELGKNIFFRFFIFLRYLGEKKYAQPKNLVILGFYVEKDKMKIKNHKKIFFPSSFF